ncbi:unnamed protein product [Orchesella dallaii]|uniref:Transmembrane protein n=1 Tax=Orchesella dallaii TaxID=48710 RepID=A0ABP1SAK7_9HEXA
MDQMRLCFDINTPQSYSENHNTFCNREIISNNQSLKTPLGSIPAQTFNMYKLVALLVLVALFAVASAQIVYTGGIGVPVGYGYGVAGVPVVGGGYILKK